MSTGASSVTRLTVFSHFFNEEFLLPYWLRHHRRLFDHGVMVDRGSTDRSAEIVRELAPDWDVVESRSMMFDADDCDLEMMELERQHEGWKAVLNTTEFLFHDDLRGYLAAFERAHPSIEALGIPSVTMVDRPQDRGLPLTDDDLFFQRFHGYLDEGRIRALRYLHRGRDGAYGLGRHGTHLPSLRVDDLLLLWFFWSPYDHVRERRLRVQARMTSADRRRGAGWHHFVGPAELDAQYAEQASWAYDLRTLEWYRVPLARLQAQWGPAEPPAAAPPQHAPVAAEAAGHRRRVVCLVPDGVDEAAPLARRTRHLAAALADEHDVRLVAAADADHKVLQEAEVVVVRMEGLAGVAHSVPSSAALVVDLEGASAGDLEDAPSDAFFLCADASHADLVIGLLAAQGLVAPLMDDHDPRLTAVLTTIPSTFPDLDGLPHLEEDHPERALILWGGDLDNWLDPLTLVRAVATVRRQEPDVRLLFASTSRQPLTPGMRNGLARQTRSFSDEVGLTGSTILFEDGWDAPEKQRRWLSAPRVGVTLHGGDLDPARYGSRALDYLCGGLPVITTAGDPLTALIEEQGAGFVVPPRDVGAVASALLRLIADKDLAASCRSAARAVAPQLRARAALDPLLRFCRDPRRGSLAAAEPAVPAWGYQHSYRFSYDVLGWYKTLAAASPPRPAVEETRSTELARVLVRRVAQRFRPPWTRKPVTRPDSPP